MNRHYTSGALRGPTPVIRPALAQHYTARYSCPVTANSVTGFGDPKTTRRTSAPSPIAGAFFVPSIRFYGGCAWETARSAGFRVSRFANLRTAATHIRLATIRGSSTTHGAIPMKLFPARNPSSSRAAAYRARGLAALRSDSSLSVRLRRYNEAMTKARALEAKEAGHA